MCRPARSGPRRPRRDAGQHLVDHCEDLLLGPSRSFPAAASASLASATQADRSAAIAAWLPALRWMAIKRSALRLLFARSTASADHGGGQRGRHGERLDSAGVIGSLWRLAVIDGLARANAASGFRPRVRARWACWPAWSSRRRTRTPAPGGRLPRAAAPAWRFRRRCGGGATAGSGFVRFAAMAARLLAAFSRSVSETGPVSAPSRSMRDDPDATAWR